MRCVLASWMLAVGLLACAAAPLVPEATAPVATATPRCREQSPIRNAVRLPFGFYSAPVDRFAEMADAGVTMVGPYYGAFPDRELLDAAASHGLQVVFPVGFTETRTEEEARAMLAEQIAAVAGHDAIAAWYVLPEELRPWVPAEMDYVAWVRETIRAQDPRQRPMLGYQPNHRQRDGLAEASASFDVVTRGLYANYVGAAHQRAWVREGAVTIAEATGATQSAWAVLEMFEQPDPDELGRIGQWVRHDVYASLVSGARGVLVFSGWPREGFPAYAQYLDAYLEVATELNGPRALATPLLVGTPAARLALETLDGPAEVELTAPGGARTVRTLASREVRYGTSTWLYVVNSAETSLRVRIAGIPEGCEIRTMAGPSIRGHQLDLPALGVSVLRIPAIGSATSMVGPGLRRFP